LDDPGLGTPIDIELTVENNLGLSAGQPGRRICSTKLQLFTGIIMNTGTATVNFSLETPKGVSNKFSAPPGGYLKLTNCAVFALLVDATATISLVGYVQTYATQNDFLQAATKSDLNTAGLFSINVNSAARPPYYDRNPKTIYNEYWAYGVTPHTAATRWTYTVPTARKAIIESAQVRVYRSTAGTAASLVYSTIAYHPTSGTDQFMLVVHIWTNTVGDKDQAFIGLGPMLYAGDIIEGYDYDASTGGDCDFMETTKLTEFDA
jgi:hypothetical protein